MKRKKRKKIKILRPILGYFKIEIPYTNIKIFNF